MKNRSHRYNISRPRPSIQEWTCSLTTKINCFKSKKFGFYEILVVCRGKV